MQMSWWINAGNALDDNFLCSHRPPRPTSEYFPEHICLWFDTAILATLSIFFSLFYLLVCCFVGSSLVISCVTSASQLCRRLFEIQNSVLTISS